MDKNPLTEPKTEQIRTETYRDSHERASKRKASSRIANLTRGSSTEDEEDKWYNCSHDKKRRIRPDSKSSNVQRDENQPKLNDCHERATSSVIMRQGSSINDNNSDADPDNEHIRCVRSKKIDEENESVSTDLNVYPRRIVPPNPSKPRPRPRKAIATSKPSPKTRVANKPVEQVKKQKNILTDSEIEQLIEEWDVDEEKVAVKKNVEMRPLPIPKEVRSRLHEKRLSLRNMKVIKETRALKEEESDGQKKEKRPKLCEREEEESCRIRNGTQSWERQLMSDDEDSLFETNQVS